MRAERKPPRRIGRPPAASGEETRARLVRSARQCFADYGYSGTSNRHIAEASGLTTGAIYHYFASKQVLYQAAHDGVQEQIYARFEKAIQDRDSLLDELGAVLDEAVQLNREDPSLARFLLGRTTDLERYPELGGSIQVVPRRAEFFGAMLERAVARGELHPDRVTPVGQVIRVVLAGLVLAAFNDVELQAASVAAFKRLLAGELLSTGTNGPT